ncbi:MAG: hypothetical protein AAFQ24_12815 [Pseudomonadota bacterium]
MAVQSESKIQEFRADARLIGAHLSANDVEQSFVDKPSLTDTFVIKAGLEGNQQNLELKGGGRESVSGTDGSTFTASIFAALREKDRARRESTSRLVTFLDLLDSIERQIAALDDQIAEYEAEVEQLEEQLGALEELKELAERGELDPTNQEHMRLLELSGIPRDQWGLVTPDMLDDRIDGTRDRIEDLRQKIQIAKEKRGELEDKYDDIHARMDNDPDAKADPETQEVAQQARQDFYAVERELSESETEWFIRSISNAPRGDWEGLIERLEDRSISDLRVNQELPPEIRDFLYVCEFEQLFEAACIEEPTDVHHYILMDMLENTDQADIQTLLRSEDTPEYIRAAMTELGMTTPDQSQDPHHGRDQ